MGGHYTYFQHVIENEDGQKFLAAFLLSVILLFLGRKAAARLSHSNDNALIPETKLTLFTFFDLLIEGFVGFHDSILGKENRKYINLSVAVFIFVLFSNLLGLIPGMPAITTTVWINVALALVVFTSFNYYGIKSNGLFGYLKHFWGPIWWLGPFIFSLEILSTCLRILTLNLRLYWNITADHLVLSIFTDLVPFGVPVAFYALGTFVCFMQAFVFTILTMVYILLATQHEEEGHSH